MTSNLPPAQNIFASHGLMTVTHRHHRESVNLNIPGKTELILSFGSMSGIPVKF